MNLAQAIILAVWLVFEGIMIIVLGAFSWDALRIHLRNRKARK